MNQDDLTEILSALTEPIFLVRANRQISIINRAAEELFGRHLVGRDFVHAIRDPDALKCVDATIAGEPVADTTITLSVPERTIFRISAMFIDVHRDVDAHTIVTLHDISHVHEAEQMRSDFVANVSHELRSPLTALIGGIETLKGAARDDSGARERFLNIMEREAARMNRLVGDLLSLSRVEVNAHRRPTEIVDVGAIVERAAATLAPQAASQSKAIRLDRSEGRFEAPGDEDELTQVFHNLIENALKYSREKSEVRVSVSGIVERSAIAGPAIAIAVCDQGQGIASEHIPRLTERFYRVDDSRSREKGGTGLGLAIVKHVINRHRGRLLIESRVGEGSTFTVCLPKSAPARESELS